MSRCAFRRCENRYGVAEDVKFFVFPKNAEVKDKWIRAVDPPDGWVPDANDRICHLHFPKIYHSKDSLPEDVIPRVTLNHCTSLKAPLRTNNRSKEVTFSKSLNKKEVSDSKKQDSEQNICRLCGMVGKDKMNSIFDPHTQTFEKITFCLPIFTHPTDGMPQQVCSTCLSHLDIAWQLREKAITTDTVLKERSSVKRSEIPTSSGLQVTQLPLEGPVLCDICDEKFFDMTKFDQHASRHMLKLVDQWSGSEKEKFSVVCSDCGHIFPEKNEYTHHKSILNHKCNQCEVTYQTECNLNVHKCKAFKTSGGKKYFVTEQVDDDEIENDDIQEIHIKEEEDEDEAIPSTSHRRRNSTSDGQSDLNICKPCNLPFSSFKLLSLHSLRVHGISRLWICKYCGKSMTTKLSLEVHERIHSGAKPYVCEWCGNAFRSRPNLMQHVVTHTGVRKYSCPKCGKKFSRKSFVRTHMRVHTGERPFACDICGHRFTQVGDMRRHRKRHEAPAPRHSIPLSAQSG